jgi:hypothetical protein
MDISTTNWPGITPTEQLELQQRLQANKNRFAEAFAKISEEQRNAVQKQALRHQKATNDALGAQQASIARENERQQKNAEAQRAADELQRDRMISRAQSRRAAARGALHQQ